ncbi:MAG TPA: MEDS domain-containing protein [Nitrososphaera sp.]|nr:MEDS domain-containing protein [Nitrososphaera sp.]
MIENENRATTFSKVPSKNSKYLEKEGKNTLQIIRDIRRSEFKEHNMLLYPDLQSYREIYSECTKQALENDEVVFLATTYDSFKNVDNMLRSKGISVDEERKEGNLVIVDAVRAYQIDTYGAMNLAKSLITRGASEKKTGVFNISDMGSFFLTERTEDLVQYEQSLPKKMDLEFVAICAYHKDNFGMLTDQQQQALLSFHNTILNVKN